MKFKPQYFYIILVVILVALIVIFTQKKSSNVPADIANKEIPNDEIHKGLKGNETPGKSNVSAEVIHKMEELKKAAEENPNDTLKLREYADFLSEAHKPDEAIQYYQKILQKYPKRTDILFSLSLIYYNKHNYNKTEELTNKILSYDKNNPLALYNLGAIYATKGDNKRAEKLWNEIIQKYPNTEAAKIAKQSLMNLKN
jgi:tetratricopeptide (TPR) repeat protein